MIKVENPQDESRWQRRYAWFAFKFVDVKTSEYITIKHEYYDKRYVWGCGVDAWEIRVPDGRIFYYRESRGD